MFCGCHWRATKQLSLFAVCPVTTDLKGQLTLNIDLFLMPKHMMHIHTIASKKDACCIQGGPHRFQKIPTFSQFSRYDVMGKQNITNLI